MTNLTARKMILNNELILRRNRSVCLKYGLLHVQYRVSTNLEVMNIYPSLSLFVVDLNYKFSKIMQRIKANFK